MFILDAEVTLIFLPKDAGKQNADSTREKAIQQLVELSAGPLAGVLPLV